MTFVGVPGLDDDDAMRAFVDRHGLDAMTQVVDDDRSIWDRFGVRVQPAWVFLPDGGEPEAVYGALLGEALDERIRTTF